MADETKKWFLMTGKEAMDPENILSLFEKLKGRKATNEERAELNQRAAAAQATALNTAEHDLECQSDGGR